MSIRHDLISQSLTTRPSQSPGEQVSRLPRVDYHLFRHRNGDHLGSTSGHKDHENRPIRVALGDNSKIDLLAPLFIAKSTVVEGT